MTCSAFSFGSFRKVSARCLSFSLSPVRRVVPAIDAAVSFGRRSEDAKASEVEIKKIRRRIDAAQGAVKFEIVAGIRLYKSTGEDYLEDVSS